MTRTWPETVAALHGMWYVLDGIHGQLKDDSRKLETRLIHEPSKRGKRTRAYQETKAKLHDDWMTDLSQSERAAQIAVEILGDDWFNQ